MGRGLVIIDSSICVAVITGAEPIGERDDAPRDRYFLERQFDTEVAARDHHRVGRVDDASMLSSAESFSILATTKILGDFRAQLGNVRRATHEAQGEVSRLCSGRRRRPPNFRDRWALTATPGRFIPLWL